MNNFPKLATENECTGCLVCIDSCSKNALRVKKKYGHKYIAIDKYKCSKCGICEKVCPILKTENFNKIENIKIYGAWSKNDDVRKKSASGGAFAEIALKILNEGGVVAGAAMNNTQVFHILIEDKKDLYKLQNNKYLQSDTVGIYRKVKEKLHQNKVVLFSGTSCQVAGLNSFLGNKMPSNLITADLLCHGVPSEDALEYHLRKYNSSKIISYRDKHDGWWGIKSQCTVLEIERDNTIFNKKLNRKEDFFYLDFLGGLSSRISCCNCKFSSLPRIADITLGDYWGTKASMEEQKKGVSLVFTNTPKGNEVFLSVAELNSNEVSMESCIFPNPRIHTGFTFIKYHPIIMFRNILYKILPYDLKHSILTNQMPWKLLWGVFRLPTKIYEKNKAKRILKKFKKVNI